MTTLKNQNIKRLYDHKLNKEYVNVLERDLTGKKPSILSDTMFKCMFVHENKLKYSCKFLSYFLDVSYDELLKTLRLGKNELDKEHENSKGERADYVAHINDDIVNIEVNCNDSIEALERNMEYVYRLYSRKIKRGSSYQYSKVIQFNINNFAFDNNKKSFDIFYIRNDEGVVLNDKIAFVQIYIPNIKEKWYTNGIKSLSDLEKYLLLLVETSISESKALAKGDIIMEDYIEDAIDSTQDEWFGEAYDKEWALKDQGFREGVEEGMKRGLEQGVEQGMKRGLEQGVEQGMKQGIGQGIKQGIDQGIGQGIEQNQRQIVRKMFEKNYDLKEIANIVGLTEEEVNEIKEDLK